MTNFSTVPLSPWRFLFRHAWRFRGLMIQATVMISIMGLVNLPLPLLQKVVIDLIIPSGSVTTLLWVAIFAFSVRSSVAVFQVFQNYVISRVTSGVGDDLRRAMSKAMLEARYEDFSSGLVGGYLGRLTGDVQTVEQTIHNVTRFIVRPLSMILVMAVVMSCISVPATILILTFVPTSVYVTRRLRLRLRRLEKEMLEQRQALQLEVTEVLDNIRVIRSFTREELYQKRVEGGIENFTETCVHFASQQQLIQRLIDFIMMLPALVIRVVAGCLVGRGEITLGDFMVLNSFELLLRNPLAQLAAYILRIPAELVATERVQEVIALPTDRHDGTALAKNTPGEIKFADMTFSYGAGEPVLAGITETIALGERIAIVGESGGGKSTLVNLLLGFYTPQSGGILLDNNSLPDLASDSLRRAIGVVFQDNPMFDTTIRENLVLGREGIADDNLWVALEQADAAKFVRDLPLQLDTRIGVKGLKLSGGQRQRLALVRVILRQPRIVILDEATSSLDSVSESQIQAALDQVLADRTSITIAHRLSTVVKADRIWYFANGGIAESGTHQELIAKGGKYYALFKAQTAGLLRT